MSEPSPSRSLRLPSRRTFIVAGLTGGVVLATAYWLRGTRSGNTSGAAVANDALDRLDPQAPSIVAAIAAVLLDGALPPSVAERNAALQETVGSVSRIVAGMPPFAQKELGQLFALLAFAPTRLAVAGLTSPWPQARSAEVAATLERWRTSRFELLRSAYGGLHQIVFAAWYGAPRAWPDIGYPGPPALS